MIEFPGKWFEPLPRKQEIGAANGTASVGIFTVWLRPFDDFERDYSLEIELEERLNEVRRWKKVVKVAMPELKSEAITEPAPILLAKLSPLAALKCLNRHIVSLPRGTLSREPPV